MHTGIKATKAQGALITCDSEKEILPVTVCTEAETYEYVIPDFDRESSGNGRVWIPDQVRDDTVELHVCACSDRRLSGKFLSSADEESETLLCRSG